MKESLYSDHHGIDQQRGSEFDHRGPLCVLSILTMGKKNKHSNFCILTHTHHTYVYFSTLHSNLEMECYKKEVLENMYVIKNKSK